MPIIGSAQFQSLLGVNSVMVLYDLLIITQQTVLQIFQIEISLINMKNSQAIAFIALTSTSLIVIICYWLLAFFKIYFQFRQRDSLLTDLSQNCPFTPEKYYTIVRFSITQWITIILASLCIIIELGIFMMICIISKDKGISDQVSDIEVDESKEKQSDQATHSYMINENSSFKAVLRDEPVHRKKKSSYFFIIAISILFINTGTNIGHTIQAILSLNSVYQCIKQKQTIKGLLENYIVLAALLGYILISTAIRMVIVGILTKSEHFYQRKAQNHKHPISIAIQTERKREKGEGQSIENIKNNDMAEDKDSILGDSINLNQSRIDHSGIFHMPKLKFGSYYDDSKRK